MSDIIQIIILGYALGSIPFGVLLAKLFRLPDPRYIGSGNIGATNILRTGRKDIAALTLLLDAGKGAASVIITGLLFISNDSMQDARCYGVLDCPSRYVLDPRLAALALLFAAIGHMFTPWLKFKGGKGVATMLGAALAFAWPVGMGAIAIWLIVFYTKRYVSLASIIALAAMPLITWLRVDAESAALIAVGSALAIWRHRSNIDRLRQGFEPKMHFRKGDRK